MLRSRVPFYVGAFTASFMMAIASGCASGGFKLTRQYAGWVNSQNIILRIVIYLLTGIVFAVTLLIDAVIFNTIDFWQGKVSANTYQFQDGDKTFHVQHEILDSKLKRSTINVFDNHQTKLQQVVLQETSTGEIEMYVDGTLRTKVRGISEVPIASFYNKDGSLQQEQYILGNPVVATAH